MVGKFFALGDEGRFESEACTYAQVVAFVDAFDDLFSNDARADLWVGSTSGDGLLVLDEHDLRYAYRPLEAFERALAERGFAEGVAELPAPHEHRYNDELDDAERRLRAWPGWRQVLPL